MFLYRLPSLRNVAIPLLFAVTTLMVFAGQAHAANIDPVGIGDLMPSPDSKVPKGQGTLYETYDNPNLWTLDSDYGTFGALDPILESIADICMALISVLGTACIVTVRWIFNLTSIPELENAITTSIGGAAKGLSVTLLPTALAVGGLVAFAQQRKGGGGGGLSQIAWVFVSGVVAVSLLTTPKTWVDGVDSVRQIGAGITMNATAQGIGDGSADFPFEIGHEPKFSGKGRDDMLRKSSDAMWRAYVATPWCIAEFGSFEVCKKYGKDVLDKGTDKDKRKEFLQEEVNSENVGDDSVTWRQGHNPLGRIMVTLPALASVILFAVLILTLAFTSLASFLGALILLVVGVLFASLWVIPGRPRQWGLAWFDQVLARTLESTIVTLILGCVLILQTACTQMFNEYGWLPTTGLTIATASVAVKFRGALAQIIGVSGSTTGALGGYLATRALGEAAGALLGGRGRRDRAHGYKPVQTRGGGSLGGRIGGGGGPSSPSPVTGAGGEGIDGILTRVRPRPPAPPPLPEQGEAPGSPSGTGHVLVSTATVTLDRDRPEDSAKGRATIPPPDRPRPALPTDQQGAASRLATLTRPTPVMRPEIGKTPNYGFRQAPPPLAPGESKRVQATVIRSTSDMAPSRRHPAAHQPSPPRATAPVRRTGGPAPAPRTTTPGTGTNNPG